MFSLAQILLLFLCLLGFLLVIVIYKQKKVGGLAFLFWLLLWIVAALVVKFPDSTMVIAKYVGIGRGSDFVLYLSVILILYLLFRIHVRLEKVDREITQIVRTFALRGEETEKTEEE